LNADSTGPAEEPCAPRPRVIFDVQFDEGVLTVHLSNIGDLEATHVTTSLDKRITGLAGRRQINDLNILREIAFFPPQKTFTFLLDSAASYFARKEPTRFTATISYSDSAGNTYREEITHDLEIYRDLPYRVEGGGAAVPQG